MQTIKAYTEETRDAFEKNVRYSGINKNVTHKKTKNRRKPT